MKSSPVTHQQIADEVGVSRVAVSLVLHRSRRARISAEKQREIEEVARQMGYRPPNRTTHTIGYVVDADKLQLMGESRMLLLMDRALRSSGYRLLLTTLQDGDTENLQEILNPKTVDAVVFIGWFDGRSDGLLPPEVPWIVIGDEDAIPQHVDKVIMDTKVTAARVARALIDRGHKRLGVVSSAGVGAVTSHLKAGVQQALYQAGISEKLFSLEVATDREIAPLLLERMSQAAPPTALLVFGPEKTITVLSVLRAAGICVPEQVSLVSLTDSHALSTLAPAVTATTALGSNEAAAVVERLLEKINDPLSPARHLALPGEIVWRDSVAAAFSL
jgi:LacI family transcriptional regulator